MLGRSNPAIRRAGTSAPPHLRTSALLLLLAAAPTAARAEGGAAAPGLGQQIYNRHCAICHADNGSGAGAAAPLFTARPRDFRTGTYKFRSTGSGQLPTDEDLARTVSAGLPGSGMVPQSQLSAAEIAAVVKYIEGFSPRFAKSAAPKPLKLPAQVPREQATPERGRQVYVDNGCPECHGDSGRGDGPSAAKLSVRPADLTDRPLKGGSSPADVVRSILTGLDGTAMPSFDLVIDNADVWALAYWIESIGGAPHMKTEERVGWNVEEREPPAGRYTEAATH